MGRDHASSSYKRDPLFDWGACATDHENRAVDAISKKPVSAYRDWGKVSEIASVDLGSQRYLPAQCRV